MNQLNENDKAAIAAGLWDFNLKYNRWPKDAPDMHDPANLWRALEGLQQHSWTWHLVFNPTIEARYWLYLGRGGFMADGGMTELVIDSDSQITMADAVFAALVALYDAEHPEEN